MIMMMGITTMCVCVCVCCWFAAVGFDSATKFWCRARPGDPWRDAQQQEQDQFSATYATNAPGAAAGALPNLAGLSGLAAAVVYQGLSAGGAGAKPIPGLGSAGPRPPPPGVGGECMMVITACFPIVPVPPLCFCSCRMVGRALLQV
jgi:hypothetical protein